MTTFLPIGIMLIPFGFSILIQSPEDYILANIIMFGGAILGVVGFVYAVRDKRIEQREAKVAEEQRKAQEKKAIEYHYLDRLIQYEMLKALGTNPRIVSRKYRRWLSDKKFQEELRKYEEEDGM